MRRDIDIDKISDGKRYHSNDLVKLGSNECEGCSECCHVVGDSIILDPWDIYMLTTNLNQSFEELLDKSIEMGIVDGLILPHLKIEPERGCQFLNDCGRCSIHSIRPGICRLFPLGRIYDGESFDYILQTEECAVKRRTKVKISKWLGIENLSKYENFICSWHYFCRKIQENAMDMDDDILKNCNMLLLKSFYMTPYSKSDFYSQFEERLKSAKNILGMSWGGKYENT